MPCGLEVAQAGREDVRPDSAQVVCQIGIALGALHELEHDEQGPPLADQAEGMGYRAVLVITLAHGPE